MHYTDEKALEEILRRSDKIKKQKDAGRIRLLSTFTILLFAGLITAIISFAGPQNTQSAETAYGAFLLSSKAGGYILVAVIAFAAGAVLAFLMNKYRKLYHNEKNK